MRKTGAIAVKEFRQIGRDRRRLFILLFVPAFLLLLYGYALNFDIRNVTLAVEDQDRSTESRELVSAFVNSGYFQLVAAVETDEEIVRLIDRNVVRAALVVPADFGRDAANGRPTSVQVIIDGDNANTATTVMGYVQSIVGSASAQYELRARALPSGRPIAAARLQGPLVVLEPRVWYNPELRSALFLIPGLIAYILMITAVVSTALSIVREKEMGTMEQVRMSPIGPLAYVVGKTVPYFALSLLSCMGIVVLSMALFGLPMRGGWLMLLAAVSLFLIGTLALGLFISTLADTQQVAFQLALLLSYLPTLMLSGFIFPISSMPAFLQLVTYIVPARYFLSALRGIVLKGVGLEMVWRDLAALVVFGAAIVALASLRLKREWT